MLSFLHQGAVCTYSSALGQNRKGNLTFKVHVINSHLAGMLWAERSQVTSMSGYYFSNPAPGRTSWKVNPSQQCVRRKSRIDVPMLGEEGSHTLDESLYVLETCSDSFFLVLPPALWCFFLFFTKIFPISSIGLGSGTPGSSWRQTDGWWVEAKWRRME